MNLENYYLVNDLIEQIETDDEKNKNMLLEYQNNFIKNWLNNKLNKFNESYYKSWDPLQEVPYESIIIKFLFRL